MAKNKKPLAFQAEVAQRRAAAMANQTKGKKCSFSVPSRRSVQPSAGASRRPRHGWTSTTPTSTDMGEKGGVLERSPFLLFKLKALALKKLSDLFKMLTCRNSAASGVSLHVLLYHGNQRRRASGKKFCLPFWQESFSYEHVRMNDFHTHLC